MKLLEQVRQPARVKHFSYRTEQCYAYWIERFIRFHNIRHPNTMAAPEVEAFLTPLCSLIFNIQVAAVSHGVGIRQEKATPGASSRLRLTCPSYVQIGPLSYFAEFGIGRSSTRI